MPISRYQAIVEAQSELISLAHADGTLVYVNPAYAAQFGRTTTQMIGTSLFDVVAEADQAAVREHLARVMHSRVPATDVNRMRGPGGALCWVSWSNSVVLDDDGVTPLLHSVGRDITELVQSQQAQAELSRQLADQHERLRVTLHSIGDAVISTDIRGTITYLNPAAERLTGWPACEAVGQPVETVFRLVHEASRQPVTDPVQRCLLENRTITLPGHSVLVARDGSEYGVEDSAAPIHRADGEVIGAVLVFRDVSAQRELVSEISHRASHDALTGLVNRAEFEQRLQRALVQAHEHGREHALLYIDLDQFKPVNDSCGHAAGDRLLRQISALLQQGVRSRDTLARLGGDEFGLILEHCDLAQAERIANEVRTRIDQFRFVHLGRHFRVGASVGLVPLDARWSAIGEALQAADAACYAAKQAGRNRVSVWTDPDQRSPQQRQAVDADWLPRLQQALADDGFVLFGQRIIALNGAEQHLQCEVLLRLPAPDGTLLAPAQFLAPAARLGLLTRIDLWVVRQILQVLARPGARLPVHTLSINLSGASILDGRFRDALMQLLAAHAADGRRLCFEIGEAVALASPAETLGFITMLRTCGVRFAIDGFGHGVALLGLLRELPIDYLKIDASVMRGLAHDPAGQALVRCIHEIARALDRQTIAGHVEDDAVHAALARIGIDHAQGYLLHAPARLEQVLGLAGG